MKINHIDDADVANLRMILRRMYDTPQMRDDERRDLANLLWLVIGRIETAEVEIKEHEDG
jgi:hypothetical protein